MTGYGYNNDLAEGVFFAICCGIIFFWALVYWLAYKVIFRFSINTKKKWNKEMALEDLKRNKVTFEDIERYVKEHKK